MAIDDAKLAAQAYDDLVRLARSGAGTSVRWTGTGGTWTREKIE